MYTEIRRKRRKLLRAGGINAIVRQKATAPSVRVSGIMMEAGPAIQQLGGGNGRPCGCRESGWTADRVECRVTHRISSDPCAVLPDVS